MESLWGYFGNYECFMETDTFIKKWKLTGYNSGLSSLMVEIFCLKESHVIVVKRPGLERRMLRNL